MLLTTLAKLNELLKNLRSVKKVSAMLSHRKHCFSNLFLLFREKFSHYLDVVNIVWIILFILIFLFKAKLNVKFLGSGVLTAWFGIVLLDFFWKVFKFMEDIMSQLDKYVWPRDYSDCVPMQILFIPETSSPCSITFDSSSKTMKHVLFKLPLIDCTLFQIYLLSKPIYFSTCSIT